MSYKVIVTKPVSQAVRQCRLSRHVVVDLFNTLYFYLETDADRYRGDRDVVEPESSFRFRFVLAEGDTWHICRFTVNDTTAQGILFVESFAHRRIEAP